MPKHTAWTLYRWLDAISSTLTDHTTPYLRWCIQPPAGARHQYHPLWHRIPAQSCSYDVPLCPQAAGTSQSLHIRPENTHQAPRSAVDVMVGEKGTWWPSCSIGLVLSSTGLGSVSIDACLARARKAAAPFLALCLRSLPRLRWHQAVRMSQPAR